MANQKRENSTRRTGTFQTPGGQTYLENLRRLHPTELTEKAIREVEEKDAQREQH